ncbi:MAG: ABC transporter ATP-binding protein/permease, partial [Gammaproteobacteria bacterium]|nr:ABC transporter ATP-binding protein/permease [Gammaproteobacteria bacterium]
PNLLVSGFTILLQTVVGFILVSMYHPLFLILNTIIAFLIWVIWAIWGRYAIASAVEVSHQKHETAAWLQSLGYSNGFYKSKRHIDEALRKTDEATGLYIEKHIKHFRHHFSQTVSFLILYAAASAALLGLGGWLVIDGALTLGQLVAAELVLSAAFYGVSYLGIYLAYFYELCASVDELSLFFGIEQEPSSGDVEQLDGDARLTFVECRGSSHGMTKKIHFEAPSGARIMGVAETASMQREFCNLLKRHIRPLGGYVAVGGIDIRTLRSQALSQEIKVLDRPSTVEMTIRDYLQLNAESRSNGQELEALKLVGLEPAVMMLDQGLDTRLSSTGWPLTTTETIQLKLAAALIARPRVLVLSQLLDVIPEEDLRRSLDALQANCECTVVYFTARHRDMGFDNFLFLGTAEQKLYTSFEALGAAAGLAGGAIAGSESDDVVGNPGDNRGDNAPGLPA